VGGYYVQNQGLTRHKKLALLFKIEGYGLSELFINNLVIRLLRLSLLYFVIEPFGELPKLTVFSTVHSEIT
jgi:hypothetical protein